MSDVTTPAPDAPAATAPVQPPPVAAAQPVPVAPAVIPPVAPVAAPAVVVPPVVVAPAPVQPAVDVEPAEGQEPVWLKKRLAQAERSVLRKLGVDSDTDAKAAIDAHRARIEAEKSELQRANEKAAKVDQLEAQNREYLAAVTSYAEAELRGLTPAQRAAVESVAGESPAKRIEVLKLLRPTWVAAAEAAQAVAIAEAAAKAASAAPVPVTPAPLPPPASTAPVSPAPALAAPQVKTPLEVYRDLQKANPMRAAQFRVRNEAAIAAAEKTAPPA